MTPSGRFILAWRAIQGPPLHPEHRFHPTRKWRFDYAHPETKTAIEIEGAVWTRGRHTRGQGFLKDCEKYNAAALLGWTVFRLAGDMVDDTEALQRIADLICGRSSERA